MIKNVNGLRKNFAKLLILILAGEIIFFLPFLLPRIFKPTLLDVLQIDNTDLGLCFSVYGIVAVLAYFFGGPLADKYPPRWLLSSALFLTGWGGIALASFPSLTMLKVIYGYWGFTTIFLFWAALMKSTRIAGGGNSQGKAFGILDGGRGLVSALIATIGVAILSSLLPEQLDSFTETQKKEAFLPVIYTFTGSCFVMAFIVLIGLKDMNSKVPVGHQKLTLSLLKSQIIKKEVLLQAVIILCAYSGYRVTDDFSLLAKDVLGYSDVEASTLGAVAQWLRPPVAIIAGVLADKWKASRMVTVSFSFMLIAGLAMWLAPVEVYSISFIALVVSSTCAGVYALRGLYFAIMEEAKIPELVTGSAVGIASMIGYLPDIYMAPLMGVFLDAHPGEARGHQLIFMLMTGFSIVGFMTSLWFNKICTSLPKRNQNQ